MADLKVRNLDDRVALALRTQAKLHGISLEEEVRRVLTRSVQIGKDAFIRRAAALRATIGAVEVDPALDSVSIIREERDAWG